MEITLLCCSRYGELQPLSVTDIIEKLEDLQKFVKELKQVKEIAVDLEHHNYRSFLGITCLMQVTYF